MAKKTWKHFIVITPALFACEGRKPLINPPRDFGPPPSYGPRETQADGTCTVFISGNPPQNYPVSCTAPIEKFEGGCAVASVDDPERKIGVACEPSSPQE